jgi:hypothetical protein
MNRNDFDYKPYSWDRAAWEHNADEPLPYTLPEVSWYEMDDATALAIKYNRVKASRYQKKRAAEVRKRYSKQLLIGV